MTALETAARFAALGARGIRRRSRRIDSPRFNPADDLARFQAQPAAIIPISRASERTNWHCCCAMFGGHRADCRDSRLAVSP